MTGRWVGCGHSTRGALDVSRAGLTINTRTKPGVLHAARGALDMINMHTYSAFGAADMIDELTLRFLRFE